MFWSKWGTPDSRSRKVLQGGRPARATDMGKAGPGDSSDVGSEGWKATKVGSLCSFLLQFINCPNASDSFPSDRNVRIPHQLPGTYRINTTHVHPSQGETQRKRAPQ